MKEKVLVFGFSENPERYSNKAFNLLQNFDYEVVAFNPRVDDPNQISDDFHTLTLYVSESISKKFENKIMKLKFKRIIFNPGSENQDLELKLENSGVEIVHGCTLVMLNTHQF